MIKTPLALGIALEAIEILRRAPAWLLIFVAALASCATLLIIAYFSWIVGGLAGFALWQARHRIAGRRA